MADSQNKIGLSMTVDVREAMKGLQDVAGKIRQLMMLRKDMVAHDADTSALDKRIVALKKYQLELAKSSGLVKNATFNTKEFTKNLNAQTKGSGKFNQAIGQASFAIEDFMSVYSTMGMQGALRAAGNNLSMMGHILSGPLMGGAIGLAAGALPMLINQFAGVEEEAEGVNEQLQKLYSWSEIISRSRTREFDMLKSLRDIKKIDSTDKLKGFVEARTDEITKLGIEADVVKEKIRAVELEIAQSVGKGFKGLDPKSVIPFSEMGISGAGAGALKQMQAAFRNFNLEVFGTEEGKVKFVEFRDNLLESFNNGKFREAEQLLDDFYKDRDPDLKGAKLAMQPAVDAYNEAIGENKELLDELLKLEQERRKLAEDTADVEKQRQTALQKEAVLLEKEGEAAKEKLDRLARSPIEQILQRTKDKLNELRTLAGEAAVVGEGGNVSDSFFAAREQLMGKSVKELRGMLDKFEDITRGGTGLGANLQEAVAGVKETTKRIMEDQKGQTDDVKRQDIVTALQRLETVLRDNKDRFIKVEL